MAPNLAPSRGADSSPPLTGTPNEFRIALLDEIEAARRASASSAVQLRDGRRISRVGASYQYQFSIESALQLPDDSPGDLFLEGHAPLEVTIVAVEGMRIVLSVTEDLGRFVARARLQSNLVHLLRKLVERIEDIAQGSNAGGDRLLRSAPSRTIPGTNVPPSLRGQQHAIAVALSFDTSFIWGPPGTGKTYVIGRIGEQLARSGASLLLVSHTNTAVDQAILEIANALGSALVDGSVIRIGEPRDQRLLDRPRLQARTHVEELSAVLVMRREALNDERQGLVDRLKELEPLVELGEWAIHAADDIAHLRRQLDESTARQAEAEAAENRRKELQAQRQERERGQAQAQDAQRALDEIGTLEQLLAGERRAASLAETRVAEAEESLRAAEELLDEANRTGALLRRWRGLPKPTDQTEVVAHSRRELHSAVEAYEHAAKAGEATEQRLAKAEDLVEEFRGEFRAEPAVIIRICTEFLATLDNAEATAQSLGRLANRESAEVGRILTERLAVVRDWGVIDVHAAPASSADKLVVIEAAHAAASARVPPESVERLRMEGASINARVTAIDSELQEIEAELLRVEEVVVARASVVATTLTRAYLRPSILKRRFDWVVLDEASMAPIPALWAAAALADRAVSAVGDFKQLPPIKHSTHPLAEKWLGQDVFTVSGIKGAFEGGAGPPTIGILTEQRRMHPDISAIPNQLVYSGRLEDGEGVEDESELHGWYASDWGHDSPVLLVDMANTHAWVTSVRGSNSSSRLNFLSATVSVDLAERLLRSDRPIPNDGDRARVMIGCPYRPHARLLNLLLREQGLEREVIAGTAHSFQGSEAPVVIFDLVNDEPHWRVALFNPEYDENSMRLLNVALTRARRRLIIVGDFEWIRRNARRAFLGRMVGFLLERYPIVDAVEVLPEGLASRAAAHHLTTVGAGDVRSETRQVLTQTDFYPTFLTDLSRVRERAVIYSPFMTSDRLSVVGPHLQAAAERGAEVVVVTKTVGERAVRDQESCRQLERALERWGVLVIHKKHMHEKLAFLDEDVLWSGSLNLLSFSNTQEIMERRVSRGVVKEYSRTLRMEEMLEPYRRGESSCPFCKSEVFPAEGANDPYYWRCATDGCHTRSIDQEPPRDGVITCSTCGGSVHVGEWGGKPYWRCDENARHRRPLVRTHLRLPMVRGMIPRKALAKLDRQFGVKAETPNRSDGDRRN